MASPNSELDLESLDYSQYALGTLLNILTKIVFEDTNADLAALGLTSDLAGVLWAVELDPGRSQIEYAQMRFRDPTTLGRHVDQLVDKGYLRREEMPDRRAKAVHITPAGSKITQKAIEIVRGVEEQVLRPLDTDKRQALFQILNDILKDQRASQNARQNQK